jgi:RNA 3'-terminal phosphate cyclase
VADLEAFCHRCCCRPLSGRPAILPLALASGSSELTTSRITQHLLTNAEVARGFLPRSGNREVGAPGWCIEP